MSAINIKHRLFRIHCFNKYGKNENDDCPDLEVTYYIECYEKIEKEDLDLRESYMRRKNNAPIICQHESTNNSIPENKTTDLQEVAITTETPNTFDQWTASQEDSSTEQIVTNLNDESSIFKTQEVEITTETSNTFELGCPPGGFLAKTSRDISCFFTANVNAYFAEYFKKLE